MGKSVCSRVFKEAQRLAYSVYLVPAGWRSGALHVIHVDVQRGEPQILDEFRRDGFEDEDISRGDAGARFVQQVLVRAEAASSAVTAEITLADAVRRIAPDADH